MADCHAAVFDKNQEINVTNLGHIGIKSLPIRLARRPCGPNCSLLKDGKALINNDKPSKPRLPDLLSEPYRFCGTRGTRSLQDVQYWQVKVELMPCRGQAMMCDMSFVEFGVATKRALHAASRTIIPCEDFAITVKLALHPQRDSRVLSVKIQESACSNVTDLNLEMKNDDFTWRWGFLIDVSKRHMTLYDVNACQKLYDYEIRAGVLYPVFSVVYPPTLSGVHSCITVETDQDLTLTSQLFALLKDTLETVKALQPIAHTEEGSFADNDYPGDVDTEDDGYDESEDEKDDQNEGNDACNMEVEYFSDEFVEVSDEEDDDEGYNKEDDEEMDDNNDGDDEAEARADEGETK